MAGTVLTLNVGFAVNGPDYDDYVRFTFEVGVTDPTEMCIRDSFKAIPYSTWNNRGADQIAVWIPEAAEYARPTPEPTSASKARTRCV